MQLILVRHAEAHDPDGVTIRNDRERPLTDHGIWQARLLGDFFAKVLSEKAFLASSPLVRAHQTAQMLQEKAPERVLPLEIWDELAIPADFEGLREKLREVEHPIAILVGHMDDIGDLAGKLVGAAAATMPLRKGAAALFQWKGKLRWETAVLKWWVDPELLGHIQGHASA